MLHIETQSPIERTSRQKQASATGWGRPGEGALQKSDHHNVITPTGVQICDSLALAHSIVLLQMKQCDGKHCASCLWKLFATNVDVSCFLINNRISPGTKCAQQHLVCFWWCYDPPLLFSQYFPLHTEQQPLLNKFSTASGSNMLLWDWGSCDDMQKVCRHIQYCIIYILKGVT